MLKLPTEEEMAKAEQARKVTAKRFAKYVAKLNERANKEGIPSKKKLPYYEQKDWLIERAATILGLWKGKPVGPEPQLIIYPHEAARILKKTVRSGQNALKKIREKNNK